MNFKYKRLNLIIDDESYENARWLKEKCHINISSLCREVIANKFKEMNSKFLPHSPEFIRGVRQALLF